MCVHAGRKGEKKGEWKRKEKKFPHDGGIRFVMDVFGPRFFSLLARLFIFPTAFHLPPLTWYFPVDFPSYRLNVPQSSTPSFVSLSLFLLFFFFICIFVGWNSVNNCIRLFLAKRPVGIAFFLLSLSLSLSLSREETFHFEIALLWRFCRCSARETAQVRLYRRARNNERLKFTYIRLFDNPRRQLNSSGSSRLATSFNLYVGSARKRVLRTRGEFFTRNKTLLDA